MKDVEANLRKELKSHLAEIVPVNEAEWDLFTEMIEYCTFNRRDIISQAEEVENYMYFLISGVVRSFQLRNGVDYTLRFNFPVCSITSYSSFITRQPALISIEALSKVKAFRMSYDDMQTLYNKSNMADRIGRLVIEKSFVEREMKELRLNSYTAEANYSDLVQNNPKFIKLIPQKYIASYLGIAPESLSRIKKKLIAEQKDKT